ncbi:MAG: hypothetical protein L3J58_11970 [Emcibacter sp.]|nr:hypothetical protein [Emcibacter sp.]
MDSEKDAADKSDPIRLFIRLDAGHHTGLGHAARVSEMLRHITGPLDIHICGAGAQLSLFFTHNVTFHFLAESASEEQKCANFLNLAKKHKADLLLIDQPGQTAKTWQAYHNSAFPVIAIDDYGGAVQADMIFNGTILNEYHHYPLMPENDGLYCGGEYALLNPVFGAVNWTEPTSKSLLIVIGGGDRAAGWAAALTGDQSPFLSPLYPKITMVVGGAFPETEALKLACEKLGISLRQNIPQSQLAHLLGQNSCALITGGMIVYEALASGCPAIIFPQEENLIRETDWFAAHKMALNLGYEGGMDMNLVGKMIALSYNNPTCKTQNIIDGKGIIRAARIIDEFCATINQGS